MIQLFHSSWQQTNGYISRAIGQWSYFLCSEKRIHTCLLYNDINISLDNKLPETLIYKYKGIGVIQKMIVTEFWLLECCDPQFNLFDPQIF